MLWDRDIEVNGRRVLLFMMFDAAPTLADLDEMARVAGSLARFVDLARDAIAGDVQPGSATTDYVDHHLSALSDDAWASVFGTTQRHQLTRSQFLGKMVLRGASLHTTPREVVIDYTLDGEVTNYLLAVTFDADGTLLGIDMDS